MAETYQFTVNGEARSIEADGAMPLIYALRNELGLTGTRYGCGLEQCGSCMVLIDGVPGYACTQGMDAVAGREIQTIESLSAEGGTEAAPHPLQQAFLDEQAGQCGYCLSGILISAKALLEAFKRGDEVKPGPQVDRQTSDPVGGAKTLTHVEQG